jgi:glycosyltransferase involved in cell wall biosynthesis
MKILYLTTALLDEDYNALLNKGYAMSNPSNQNFHARLIGALQKTDAVRVISLVPSLYSDITLLDSGIFTYVNSDGRFLDHLGFRENALKRAIEKEIGKGADGLLFDSLNVHLGKAATALAKKHHLPAIAILTDNPENLAKTARFYGSSVKKNLANANGVLALSEGLVTALGVSKKPHYVFPGLVEKAQEGKPLFPKNTYFYFGGALLSRYGILSLLEAYLAAEPAYDLVIAGHETSSEEFKRLLRKSPRIHYIGQVTKGENATLEKNAALLINPRPYDEKLDQESVPSKLLEYLASGSPILSTRHSALQKAFPDDVNWLEDSSVAGLTEFLKNHLDEKKALKGIKKNQAAEKVFALYGQESVGKAIHGFLNSLNASKS